MSQLINLQMAHDFPHADLIDKKRLILAARTVLEQHPQERASGLSIVIAGDETVRELNRRHRQIDAATDVLSFPAAHLPEDLASSECYLGDILIAYDYVTRQAASSGADLSDTLCLLVIHGVLHLLGYLHDTAESRDAMWQAQAAALHALRIDPAIVQIYGDIDNDQADLAPNASYCGD